MNDKNYDENLLTFLSTNKNETKMFGRDSLGRDPVKSQKSMIKTESKFASKVTLVFA